MEKNLELTLLQVVIMKLYFGGIVSIVFIRLMSDKTEYWTTLEDDLM